MMRLYIKLPALEHLRNNINCLMHSGPSVMAVSALAKEEILWR
jgi:hypothetical protein